MFGRITGGAVAGVAAAVVMGITAMIFKLLGLCDLCIISIGGGLFAGALLKTSPLWLVIGWSVHLLIGVLLGVIFVCILTYVGRDYAVVKGVVFGGLVWVVQIGVIGKILGVIPDRPPPGELLILFGYHLLYGAVLGYVVSRWVSTETVV